MCSPTVEHRSPETVIASTVPATHRAPACVATDLHSQFIAPTWPPSVSSKSRVNEAQCRSMPAGSLVAVSLSTQPCLAGSVTTVCLTFASVNAT